MMHVRGGRNLLNKIIRGVEVKELSVQVIGGITYMDIETINYVKSSVEEYYLCFGEEKHIKFLKLIFYVCLRLCKMA